MLSLINICRKIKSLLFQLKFKVKEFAAFSPMFSELSALRADHVSDYLSICIYIIKRGFIKLRVWPTPRWARCCFPLRLGL